MWRCEDWIIYSQPFLFSVFFPVVIILNYRVLTSCLIHFVNHLWQDKYWAKIRLKRPLCSHIIEEWNNQGSCIYSFNHCRISFKDKTILYYVNKISLLVVFLIRTVVINNNVFMCYSTVRVMQVRLNCRNYTWCLCHLSVPRECH